MSNKKKAPEKTTPHEDAPRTSGWSDPASSGMQQGQAGQGSEEGREAARNGAGGADVAALEVENRELKDKVLRLAADMENLRKRLEREKEEAVKYAAAQFARDMLTVSDNLSRALQHVPEEKRGESEFLKSLAEGVEMTLKGLLDTFERHGIRKLSPHGERFDPHFHQAMFEVPTNEAPAGTVVEVMADGYTHHDRVLRPAMVGVSKQEGGKKDPAGESR